MGGYGSSASGQGGYPSEPSYGSGIHKSPDYPEAGYRTNPYDTDPRPTNGPGSPDDWDTYRDYRR